MDLNCKCLNCGKYYYKDKNESTACLYHPGVFHCGEHRPIHIALGKWTCCKAAEKTAHGCKLGPHIEDEHTTARLNAFANASASLDFDRPKPRPKQVAPPQEPEKEVEEPDEYLDSGFIKHRVKPIETLQGLALKYDTTVDKIKKSNKMFSSASIPNKYLYIPGPTASVENSPVLTGLKVKAPTSRDKLAERVQEQCVRCTREEALYYLENAGGDFQRAVDMYNQDSMWEKDSVHSKDSVVLLDIV